jgi:hypothetical protein
MRRQRAGAIAAYIAKWIIFVPANIVGLFFGFVIYPRYEP